MLLAAQVDDRVAGDLVQPGPEVAALKLLWQSNPGPLPDFLVQVIAVARTNVRRDEGQKQRRMPAIEPFERVSGRTESPLGRTAPGNRGGQILVTLRRLIHEGCHGLRVCETGAQQAREKRQDRPPVRERLNSQESFR